MKSQFTPFYFLLFFAIFLVSNSANPPDGRTGAPGDDTCTSCHTGNNPNNLEGTLEIKGFPDELEPNALYRLTIRATRTGGLPVRAGFQLVALDGDNNNAGEFSNAGPSSTLTTIDDRTYFEHDPALRFEEEEEVSWSVDWISPTDASKEVTFYANSIFGNGSGSSGDLNVPVSFSKSIVEIIEPIETQVNVQDVSCFGGMDGAITYEVTGGTGNFTYKWSNGAEEPSINNLTAGEYSVTVSEDENLSFETSILVSQPDELQIAVLERINIDCNNSEGLATVEASGGLSPYQYDWGSVMTPSISLPVGEHTVTVTDGNGCTAAASITITKDVLLPQVNAGPSKEIDCKGPIIDLEGDASMGEEFSYLWTTSNGLIFSGENTLTPTIEASGIYTLLVTNTATGCSASSQVEVRENLTTPVVSAGNTKQLSCAEETTTLDGSGSINGGDFDLEWTTTDGNFVNGVNTLTPSVNQAGTYTLKITDITNGCISTATVSVVQDINMPTAFAGDTQSLNCTSNTLTLNGNGSSGIDFIYSWETEDGTIESGESTLTPTISAPGTYRLTVRNRSNGCDAKSSVIISEAPSVTATLGEDIDFDCNADLLTLNGTASTSGENITYEWTTQDGNIINVNTTTIINIDQPGTYRLTVRNTLTGCEDSDEITVTQETKAPELSVISEDELNCETPTITLQASVTDLNENLSIQWQSDDGNILEGENTLTPTINQPGTYFLGVFDTNTNCVSTAAVLITQTEDAISIEIDDMKTDGEATAIASGGTPPYSYEWDTTPIATDATIMNMPNGEYSVTVTDATGCSSIATAVIIGTTSVPNISSLEAFDVFPNPTYDGIQLNALFQIKEKGDLFLFNSLGKQLWQQSFNTNAIQMRIETQQWEGGVYYLVVQTKEGVGVEEVVILK